MWRRGSLSDVVGRRATFANRISCAASLCGAHPTSGAVIKGFASFQVWHVTNIFRSSIASFSTRSEAACETEADSPVTEGSNSLQYESSSYLLRHSRDPVRWFPYGPQALQLADEEDKILFISIGSSSSHWDNVMARECFEDKDVAALLNKDFVCVKVDKEEMPEVEGYYVKVATSLGIRAGWPLTIFAAVHQKPFFAGTFFPKKDFLILLHTIKQLWRHQRVEVDKLSEQIHEHIVNNMNVYPIRRFFSKNAVLTQLLQHAHKVHETYSSRLEKKPRIDTPTRFSAFMRSCTGSTNPTFFELVSKSLHKPFKYGVYDHVGGGFFSYTSDIRWNSTLTKEFQKTIYDNSLLAETYLEYYQATLDPKWEAVARATLDYLLNVMENKQQGGFYTSEDEDNVVEGEGRFYLWHYSALKSLLTPEEFERVSKIFGVKEGGNYRQTGLNQLNIQEGFTWEDLQEPIMQSAMNKLANERASRPPPLKDDKQLTSLNGIAIQAMAKAYRILGDNKYLRSAQKAAKFVERELWNPSSRVLLRCHSKGKSKYDATLDDYAFLISGLLELYQADFNSSWLHWAIELQTIQDELLFCPYDKSYYFTKQGGDIPVSIRMIEKSDGLYASGNSMAAYNNLRLWGFTLNNRYRNRGKDYAEHTFSAMPQSQELCHSLYLAHSQDNPQPAKHVALIFPPDKTIQSVQPFLDRMRRLYTPASVVAVAKEGETFPALVSGKLCVDDMPTAYVVTSGYPPSSFPPTTNPEKLVETLKASNDPQLDAELEEFMKVKDELQKIKEETGEVPWHSFKS